MNSLIRSMKIIQYRLWSLNLMHSDRIIGQWPNTYTFTKVVAEDFVKIEISNLPISIVRPTMITAAVQEPVPGWVDNIYSLNGTMLAIGLGLMKTLHGDKTKVLDIIPVDYVVNLILAAAWENSQKKSVDPARITECDTSNAKEAPIYNSASGSQNPITIGNILDYNLNYARTIPSVKSFWYYTLTIIKYWYLYLLAEFLFHTLHGFIIDTFLWLTNRKPRLMDGFSKMKKFAMVTSYFRNHDWHIKTDHTQKLWKNMSKKDQELFNFDISKLSWVDYSKPYCKGIRLYLLKDPMETLPQGRRKLFILKIVHYIVLFLMYYCVYFALKAVLIFFYNRYAEVDLQVI